MSWKLSLVAGLLATTAGFAQERGVVLDEVVLQAESETATGPVDGFVATRSTTASKTDTPLVETPASVSVIGAAEIAARGGVTNLGEAIAYAPGIWVDPSFGVTNDSGFSIRGFYSWGANYLDGLKVGTGMTRAGQPSIEPYGMERFEVLRGPASVLYGQVTPGGMVNTVSKRPTFTPSREAVLRYGSYGQVQTGLDMNGVNRDGTLGWRFVGYAQSGGTQMDDVDDDRIYLAPSLTWRPTDQTEITFLASWRRLRGQEWNNETSRDALLSVSPSFNPGEPGFDRRDSDQYAIGYELTHRFNDDLKLVQNLRFYRMDGTYHQVFAWNGTTGNPDRPYEVSRETYMQDQTVDTFDLDTRLQWNLDAGSSRHTLLAGVDYSNIKTRMKSRWGEAAALDFADPVYGLPVGPFGDLIRDDEWKRELGVYVQDSIQAGPWRATFGGRWSRTTNGEDASITAWNYERKQKAFVGNAGLLYLTQAGLAPYVSFAQSFQPETGTDWQGDPFDPTKARQYEIGVKYQPPGSDAMLAASAYHITQQNLLTTDPEHPDFSRQTGEVQIKGIDLEGRMRRGDWDLSLAWTWLDARITSNEDGNQGNEYTTPRHTASAWASYAPKQGPLAGFNLGGGLRYSGANWGDEANTVRNDSLLVADLAVGYDFGLRNPELDGLRLDLAAHNLGAGKQTQCSGWGCYYIQQPSASMSLAWKF
ncbi:MAG: TonB-dependent siderophore receptor [Paracoccus sp. (in: a-proteobacteria)]|uniref:TonB-dependent siderophore receptor n=1 Tax=Paracoccus sp. TaxID=267 RepID=UPI0039E2FF92